MRRLGLWPQLFALAALSIAVGLGTSTYVLHQEDQDQFALYTRHRGEELAIRVADTLGVAYARRGWPELREALDHLAPVLESPLVLRLPDGRVIIARPRGAAHRRGPSASAPVITPTGHYLGVVTIRHTSTLSGPLAGIARALNRSLWTSAGIGFLVALVLSIGLGERMVTPLRRIAQAARRLAAGDLSHRVVPSGPAEVYQLAEDFNRMAQELEASVRGQQQLIADVAHELRTPLAVLTGYLEAARDGVTVSGRDPLELAGREARLLARLVGDLQELALADARQLVLRPRAVSLRGLVAPVAEEWEAMAARRAITLTVAWDAPDQEVVADPDRIRQVLTNLLANAVRYTPAGGTIRIGVERRGPWVHIRVSDSGPGIAPEHLPHVFERLYRADPARTRPGPEEAEAAGFGLGLAIAKSLVEMHAGRIGVVSPPGGGTTFWFEWPAHPDLRSA
jgi:two-component system sensor histidine kinase BaeS